MTTLLTLDLPVKLTGGFPEAEIDVRVTPRWEGPFDPNVFDPELFDVGWLYSEQAQIAIDLDDALASSARPRTSRRQIIPPWRLSVGGKTVPWYRILPGFTVTETIEGVTTYSFQVPRRGSGAAGFMEPLGSPVAWLGVPGGKGAVNITSEFLTNSGRKSVALVRDGMLDNSSASMGDGGDTRSFNGGGAHGRIDRNLVTYQAPPGHGQTSGTVVRRILTLAGVPASKIAISGGRRLYKGIEVVDRAPIEVCNAILEPELRRVYHDERTDTWRTLDYSGVGGKRIESVIRESDVLSALGTLGDGEAADAPTSVTLTGNAQVVREECGRRTEYQVIDRYGVRPIYSSRFKQASNGSLTPFTFTSGGASEFRKTRRQVVVREFDCETLVATESVVWEWFSPEMTRYQLGTDGEVGAYSTKGYIYDPSATADDSTPMYHWPAERWTVTAWSREEHSFDAAGYLDRVTTKKGGWMFTDLPLKSRSSLSDDWDAEPFNEVWITAGGRAVNGHGSGTVNPPKTEEWYGPAAVYDETDRTSFLAADFFYDEPGLRRVLPSVLHASGGSSYSYDKFGNILSFSEDNFEVEVTDLAVNDGGFISEEVASVARYFLRAERRGSHLYQQVESNDPESTFATQERQVTTYAAAGEANHDRFWSRYRHDGELLESEETFSEQGYLPAAARREDIVPPASTYDDPAEAEFALAASRHESRPIKVRVSAPALESVLIPWEMKGRTVEFAEDEDDLAAVGSYLIREASSLGVSIPLPFNPLIRPGQRHVVHLPTLGAHYDLLIESVEHLQAEDATWTQVSGRHDVV